MRFSRLFPSISFTLIFGQRFFKFWTEIFYLLLLSLSWIYVYSAVSLRIFFTIFLHLKILLLKTIFSHSMIIKRPLIMLRRLIVGCKNWIRNIYRNEFFMMRLLIAQLSIHPFMSILIIAFNFMHIRNSTCIFICYATLIPTKTFDPFDLLFHKFDFIVHVYLPFFIS